jgi:hypothetical protein
VRILIAAILLSGCAAAERVAPYTTDKVPAAEAGGFECDAAPAQYAIGKKTSTTLAQELMAKSSASVVRWIPPRTAVTMDYSSVRLNISYDDNMVIDRVSCG